MSEGNSERTRETFELFLAKWEAEKTSQGAEATQLSGMVYMMSGEPPGGMSSRDRSMLRSINDLEAELIRLIGKLRTAEAAYVDMAVFASLKDLDPEEARSDLARWATSLHEYGGEILEVWKSAHELIMNLRTELLKGAAQ